MPQLDLNSYHEQLLWLLVLFPILYFFVAKYFIPAVSSIIKSRAEMVEADIGEAEQMLDKRRSLNAEIQDILGNARAMALELKTDSAIKAKNDMEDALKALEADLAKRARSEEIRLSGVKEQLSMQLSEAITGLGDQIFISLLKEFKNSNKMVH